MDWSEAQNLYLPETNMMLFDDRRSLASQVVADRLRQSRLLHLLFHIGNDLPRKL